jgi:hypothetical protein
MPHDTDKNLADLAKNVVVLRREREGYEHNNKQSVLAKSIRCCDRWALFTLEQAPIVGKRENTYRTRNVVAY